MSKIEAGQMDVEIKKVSTRDLSDNIKTNFQHMAKEKGLEFSVVLDRHVPESILTDPKRLEQIIRNLLSNAVKFTKDGSISVDFMRPSTEYTSFTGELNYENAIAISVTDTGIGIPKDRQRSIFEAFQQADGGTARIYGGTGLGLSISRDLKEGDKVILIIEDDPYFAKILMDQCHEKGFRGFVAPDGESGIKMAEDYLPDAIILDIIFPGISGWAVLETIKDNHEIRHIPVHIISSEESTLDALRKGAIGFLSKPAEKEQLEEVFNTDFHSYRNRHNRYLIIPPSVWHTIVFVKYYSF